ncbi:MAG: hypothetical protein IMZ61_11335 [Planctomycetes bacterium]|nr:hypothetical protein [Planctomycetota bacterium]
MNTSFAERSKNSARRLRGDWIIAAVFVAMYLTACNGSDSAVPNLPTNSDGINLPLIRLDLDLTRVVLGPEDVSDLFQGATYSINQAIVSPESQGEIVTYPTQFLAHTTAFAYGFSTRIEIFTNIDQAVKSYDTILTQQSGETLAMELVGDDSLALARTALTPEGFDLNSTEYAVLFRERNAVATIILRTDRTVSPTRLSQLTELVIDRLQP